VRALGGMVWEVVGIVGSSVEKEMRY
jgi:hypothetical protein